ncbi:Fe-S-containing hydro-lyase [bacterium]|nr:Fe-S-containing hydro-lyase [bacterium]
MADVIKLTTPLDDRQVEALHAGDSVLITGIIYSARDSAHKKLVDLLEQGQPLPLDLTGHLIYYVGPSPARPGKPIGSAGPTTSYRMNPYAPKLLAHGSRGMIGKGEMNAVVAEALKKYKGVYLVAVGGAAALIARSIKKNTVIAYPELGAEAIAELTVEDFPAIVAQDCHGGNLYQEGVKKFVRS